MQRELQGTVVKSSLTDDEYYQTYIPNYLPPVPPIDMAAIDKLLEKANLATSELNGVLENISDSDIINYMYVRKEAVLSSQIEGTQSTLNDLMNHESGNATGVPIDDVTIT